MKKCLVACAVVLCSFISMIAFMFIYGIYLPGQKLNGKDVSFEYYKDSYEELVNTKTDTIEIEFTDEPVLLLFSKYVTCKGEPDDIRLGLTDWLSRKPIDYSVPYSIDEDLLHKDCASLYVEGTDASIECVDGVWVLNNEVTASRFDVDLLVSLIVEAINTNTPHIDFREFVETDVVTASDLQEDFEKVVWLNDFKFSYENGDTLKGADFKDCVDDYTLGDTAEVIENFLNEVSTSYDTRKDSYMLELEDGSTKEIPYKTFGYHLDTETETKEIQKALEEHTSVDNRKPKLLGYDNIKDDYIVISIADQHLRVYFDGELWQESDIVTGAKGRHDTPTGVYYISECINGKYLRGADYVTWVNKWMRLTNSGIGLHDATWRGKFGGNIYTYNGSHGCINLPKKFAYDLFDKAYVGLPVIIY